ncbi:unnamed protein product [Acanthosepion pharaonis]|uniref:Uncharacterized protein n=1 Tax=Acanthosepion pharaonis TaxID=158019 RepID=A0A812D887_ACAPH|nr:unnamed protein product [Sepia pharaonis]
MKIYSFHRHPVSAKPPSCKRKLQQQQKRRSLQTDLLLSIEKRRQLNRLTSQKVIRLPLFKAPLTSLFATAFPLRRQLTPAASRSLLQLPDHSCSLQLTPAASSTPAVSSSPQQLPAASSSPLRRSTDVPLPIPVPTDVQRPLTSGHRSRTNDLCRLTIHRSQIKTRFPSSTTDHLRLSSFFAIAISLPLCPLF